MDLEGGKPIFMIFLLIAGVVVATVGVITISTQAETTVEAPQPTITATPTITTPTPTITPTIEPEEATNISNDTSYKQLQEYANQEMFNQTDKKQWTIGDPGPRIDFKPAPEKPQLELEILHDDGTPYDFYKEPLYLGKTLTGYIRVKNTGNIAYQGIVDIYVNASMFYQDQFVHMENRIDRVEISLWPGQSNDFYKRWPISEYNGAPIHAGAYEVIIELRDPRDGQTLYRKRITPIVAHWDDLGGWI